MRVNGQEVELKTEIILSEFLQNQGYIITKIAVELNGAIVPKAKYTTTILTEFDTLEVVNFVGGG